MFKGVRMKSVGFRVEDELASLIESHAKIDNISKTDFIKKCIYFYMRNLYDGNLEKRTEAELDLMKDKAIALATLAIIAGQQEESVIKDINTQAAIIMRNLITIDEMSPVAFR